MFLGHFAVAFAAKRVAPELSLGTAFAAAQWLDLLWPVLVLAGVEHVAVHPGITARLRRNRRFIFGVAGR